MKPYKPNAHAAAINTGDTVRVRGLPPGGTDPIEVTGTVEEIDYEQHDHDELNSGAWSTAYGFTFAVRPTPTTDQPNPDQTLVWAYDSGTHNVMRMPSTDTAKPISFDFTVTTDEGYQYRPWTDGRAVGLTVAAPNGTQQVILINPCGATDNGFPSVMISTSEVVADGGDPASEEHLDMGECAMWFDMLDETTVADTLARQDLQDMAIGDEPAADEIRLRAAEYLDRILLDRDGLKGLDVAAAEQRSNHDGDLLDLGRVAEWLRLYGVAAAVERGEEKGSAFLKADDTVTLGPGWFERPGIVGPWRAMAGTDSAYLTDPHYDGPRHLAGWSELETAWMVVNLLAGKPLYTHNEHGARRPARATPAGPPITA